MAEEVQKRIDENIRIVPKVIEEAMKKYYIDYAMSVIVSRALPDARDGLKPVHRRILYAMYDTGMVHNKPYKKSARIVGEVLGKYHPHGDSSVYDALVRMAQDFSLRYPLIDGQGNWGSIDGDSAAAMRYTECRLKKIAEDILENLEKETVDFIPNFDGSLKEPTLLPAKIPNLLINGASGIAVGMATNIPPHNLTEVSTAVIKLIDSPDISVVDLMGIIPGPDFPTGGIICGTTGISDAYKTGKGKIVVRAKIELEETKSRQKLVVKEIPFMVNKSELIEQIAEMVREKKIIGISDIRDESDRQGMRLVLDLKLGANPDVVLNQLFSHTRLQETFGIITLALIDNQPKILTLKDSLQAFLTHRQKVVRRRTQFELTEAENKAHILAGLIVALNDIDGVVKLIKASKSTEQARTGLIQTYTLSEKQAQAILEMRLSKLTSLEQESIRTEHANLLKLIEELKSILASETRILGIIKNELEEIKQKYGDKRRTQIISSEATKLEEEALIKPEDMIITLSHAGYIKRLTLDTYKQQRRGGKGVIAAETKEEDFIQDLFAANTHDQLLFFTTLGKVHWLKVYQIPEAGRYAKGTAIINILGLAENEKIASIIPVKEFRPELYLAMVTKNGLVKKTALDEFSNPRKGGIMAIDIEEGDNLITVLLTDGKKDLFIATQNGQATRFNEEQVRPTGRMSKGVIGIRLRQDVVIDAAIAEPTKTILTLTEKGYGKRTQMAEYGLINRGGSGVINLKVTEKNGKVVAAMSVSENEEIIIISQKGLIIRTSVKGISEIGRATQGVRIMKLDEEDKIVSAEILREDQNGNEENAPVQDTSLSIPVQTAIVQEPKQEIVQTQPTEIQQTQNKNPNSPKGQGINLVGIFKVADTTDQYPQQENPPIANDVVSATNQTIAPVEPNLPEESKPSSPSSADQNLKPETPNTPPVDQTPESTTPSPQPTTQNPNESPSNNQQGN